MLTADQVQKIVEYDPATGVFRWRADAGNRRVGGSVAGTPSNQHGRIYIVMNIAGRMYRAHRIAWLVTHKRWPIGDVDHKNGDPQDNRIENLRECSRSENLCNQKRSARNTSGVKGVHWCAEKRKWAARIRKGGKTYFLGRYATLDEARSAREAASREIHGEFARSS